MRIMTRALPVLLFAIAAFPVWAQGAGDYALAFSHPAEAARTPLGGRMAFIVDVTKPDPASEVIVELDIPGDQLEFEGNCTGPKPVRCTLPPSFNQVRVFATMNTAGSFTATARLVGVSDSNPQNDQASRTIVVVDGPSLVVSVSGDRQEPGRPGEVWVLVRNDGPAAKDVVLTLTLPDGGTFTGRVMPNDASTTCTVTNATTIVCSRAELPFFSEIAVRAEVLMPDRIDGSEVEVVAAARSNAPDLDPANDTVTGRIPLIPNILVLNTNDEGAGSLRQALLEAQQRCVEKLCTIAFRIPGIGAGQRAVIRPRSELPEVRGRVKIDGGSQTFFIGDTYPDGPEVVIDGSLAPPVTHGLLLGGPSCEMYVFELAVVNFSAPGIEAHRGDFRLEGCGHFLFPNTVIARNHLSGNYRGVAIAGQGYVNVSENVISGNRRAGVFADRSTYVEILRNRITGNGASGIFLNPVPELSGGVVASNVVSGNGEWGIARTPTGDVRIYENAIFGNRYLGIDAGLDLETPNRPDDTPFAPGVPNKPVLLSAQYDPVTNKTHLRGRLRSVAPLYSGFRIDVYASSSLSAAGHAEAERWLVSFLLREHDGDSEFEVALDGDLRGKYITATNTRTHLGNFENFVEDTSELSAAIVAQ